jgi:hypothetical protein
MKTQKQDFVIRLVGPDISPATVPLRRLTSIFIAVQQLIDRTEDEPSGDEAGTEEESRSLMPLHLIRVRKGSASYAVATKSDGAIQSLADMGRGLKHPSQVEWASEILSPVEKLSDAAEKLHCEIELRRPGKDGEVLAKISPKSYEDIAEGAFVKGESSVTAYLERAGGATAWHCGLRLPEQPGMIICRVASEELVRQLGQFMYKTIRVFGAITWFRTNMRVKTIHITAFEPSKEGSIREALDRIYEAGGKAWDDVEDVDGAIAEIRGT